MATHIPTPHPLDSVTAEHHTPEETAWFALFGNLEALLGELPVSWVQAAEVSDRRVEPRFRCDCPAWLLPIDGDSTLLDVPPVPVHIKDISRHGLGLTHDEPLPHRLVLLRFASESVPSPAYVLRLQWCRFQRQGHYESGGQVLRVVEPDSDLAKRLPNMDSPMPRDSHHDE